MIEPVVNGMGYELVDLQSSNGGRLLRLFIDKPGGIGVEDCAAVAVPLSIRHVDCLIGRVILRRGVFTYDGPNDTFSFAV